MNTMGDLRRLRRVSPHVNLAWESADTREHLHQHTFPKLSALFRSRGVDFCTDDWMGDLPQDRYEEGYVMMHALESIRRASPFFIGVLGETCSPRKVQNIYEGSMVPYSDGYRSTPELSDSLHDDSMLRPTGDNEANGDEVDVYTTDSHNIEMASNGGLSEPNWQQANVEVALKNGETWVSESEHEHCCLAELEILQASRLQEGSEFTFFYFRVPRVLDEEELNGRMTGVQMRRLSVNVPVPLEEGEERKEGKRKMKDLRNRIGAEGFPVRYFRTLAELDEVMVDDWTKMADKLFPRMNLWKFSVHDFRASVIEKDTQSLMQSLTLTYQSTKATSKALAAMYTFLDAANLESSEGWSHNGLEFDRPAVMSAHKLGE